MSWLVQKCHVCGWEIAEPIVIRCLRLTLNHAWNTVASLWILIAVSKHHGSLSASIRQRCILSNVVWPITERIIKNLLNGIQETPQKTQGMFDSPLSVMSHWETPGSRQERMDVKATVQRAFFPRGPSLTSWCVSHTPVKQWLSHFPPNKCT